MSDGGKLVAFAVKRMVDHPDEVKVTELRASQCIVIEVKVDKLDIQQVIGRRGSIAEALRQLLSSMGGKEQVRYRLEIIEPHKTPAERERVWPQAVVS